MTSKDNPEVEVRDLTPDELPTHTPEPVDEADWPAHPDSKVMDHEEHMDLLNDRLKSPVDFTVDSDAERERDAASRDQVLGYDPIIHANKKEVGVELDPASWDDLRVLDAPPPTPTGAHKVYVCIQHPSMIVFSPDGHTVLGRFHNGYLSTDSDLLQKVLASTPYVKRLEMKVGS